VELGRRTLAAVGALALAAPVLVGCGPPEPESSDDIVLWLVGTDTGDDLREHLIATFEERNPGASLTIEQKEWPTLVADLEAAIVDPQATPDVVEIGNTQAPTFATSGTLRPIAPELYAELGGPDLLQSFVEAGSVDGTVYALPYYFGSRYVFYRKDLWDEAGFEVPRTLDEFGETVAALRTESTAGLAMGGQDWRNGISWVFAHGGELAVKSGDQWVSTLADPQTVEGLTAWQEVFETSTYMPATEVDVAYWDYINGDDDSADPAAATMMAPSWARWSVGDLTLDDRGIAVRDGMVDDSRFDIFALPGVDGGVAPVFAGGSNLAVSALTRNVALSEDLLRIVYSPEYQSLLARAGLGPANLRYTDLMTGDKFGRTLVETAEASKLTPPAPGWAEIEARGIYEDLFKEIARGGDVAELATRYDAIITPLLDGASDDDE
jgi:N,N'-diacetylchitobiose transport system substrate-binding protein